MRAPLFRGSLTLVLGLLACTSGSPPNDGVTKPDAGFPDAGGPRADAGAGLDAVVAPDRPMVTCDDADHDGISDRDEGAPALDTDRDGTPDYMDADSDGDGFSDADEAARRYPGYESDAVPVFCGNQPNNCDAPPDNLANQRDLDSDNDGLTDGEERTAMTNPCAEDTDRDGFTDLAEVAAHSNPRDRASSPPANSLYVSLPYYAPGTTGARETREFTFATRIRAADVFFLVDNSASMEPTIANLRTNLQSVIIPGIRGAIPDARLGVGSFDSMPDAPEGTSPVDGLDDGVAGRPGDYAFWVRQRMTAADADVQRAFDGMHTIVEDSNRRFLGGDEPECQIEAMFEAMAGSGTPGTTGGAGAVPISSLPGSLRSVTNALDPMGNGWVAPVEPARDCPDTANAFGWACFQQGRVPIVVLFSDASWYDGAHPASPRSIHGHRYPELAASMLARGALYLGVDVSAFGTMGLTYANSVYLARATGSLNAMRREVVFAPGAAGLGGIATGIVDAVRVLANETRQDISTTVLADAAEMRLPAGRTTASFVQTVTPVRGAPELPTGYDRRDDRTFFGVLPSTQVVFRVSFYNDFLEGTDAARVFQASVVVRGRAGSEVDRRPVFIVVPARGGGLPPG
jgi:hypothetical protein